MGAQAFEGLTKVLLGGNENGRNRFKTYEAFFDGNFYGIK